MLNAKPGTEMLKKKKHLCHMMLLSVVLQLKLFILARIILIHQHCLQAVKRLLKGLKEKQYHLQVQIEAASKMEHKKVFEKKMNLGLWFPINILFFSYFIWINIFHTWGFTRSLYDFILVTSVQKEI